ncbi:MAG TPA: phospho-sugar mutase [Candidatus Onthenecus intestinigallinarum]|uniref:Phosphoglucomutase n=1 Tax=Candidatus Onthenecus intestinigallinarum TaxID=2840875 RepID=A0A9D0Z9M3_9FIRM|nr:phospho-sugar mutase [Candidatus Onthenecus intestinigallinarum]
MTYRERYEQWLRDFADDPATVAELQAIAGDEKEIEDRFYTELSFGTAGMRGVLGAGTNRMNLQNVRRATKGFADYINAGDPSYRTRGVVIAYDSRRMSPQFARAAALVLCHEGIHVYLFDELRPVPILSYAVRHLHAVAGIVITASHNPPQYNGYKVYWEDGAQMPPEYADQVLARIRACTYQDAREMDEAEARAAGLLSIIGNREVDDDYIAQVKTLSVQPELMKRAGGDLKIVYTPLHGSGNKPVRRILQEIGIRNVLVVKEQELPDPNFSTIKVPNPEDPAAFKLAMELADREGADCIFGTDPDCDRVGIAVKDGQGRYYLMTGNQIGCVLLYYILKSRKELGTLPANGAVVKSVVSTELARRIADSYGLTTFDTLTGFKFIAEKIQQFEDTGAHTFVFGFEESYGFLSSTFVRDKDGVNASLLIAEAAVWAKTQGKTLYDILMEIYRTYGAYVEKVVSVTLPGKDGLQRMQQIMASLRAQPPRELASLRVLAVRDYLTRERTDAQGGRTALDLPRSDVLYFELEGGAWVCIRPSGTEPKIKLYVNTNAAEMDGAQALNDALRAASEALMK